MDSSFSSTVCNFKFIRTLLRTASTMKARFFCAHITLMRTGTRLVHLSIHQGIFPMSDMLHAASPDGEHHPRQPHRTIFCPNCGSPHTQTRNHGKKIGGVLGTCAGVISSLSGAAKGARIGAVLAFRITATTMPLNIVTAAVIGAMSGGAIGCALGSRIGDVFDAMVLNNHLCLRCSHSFQTP